MLQPTWRTPRRAAITLLALFGLAVVAYDLSLGWRAYDDYRISQRPGFTVRRFVDSTGAESKYVVFVPHGLSADARPPVILFLNGAREKGDDGVGAISNNFGEPVWERKGRFPFVCVIPQCSRRGSWDADSPDSRRALEILDHIIARHHCDPDRVYLTGPSSGGVGVWDIGLWQPERFAALVPLCAGACGTHSPDEAATRCAQARLPVWAFYNDEDEPPLVDFNRRLRQCLLDAGLSPHFTEFHKTGHNCWDEAYRCAAMYDWLLTNSRTANATRQPFEQLAVELATGDSPREDSQGAFLENASSTLAASTSQSGLTAVGPWDPDADGALAVPADVDRLEAATLEWRVPHPNFEWHIDIRPGGERPVLFELLSSVEGPSSRLQIVLRGSGEGESGVLFRGDWLSLADPIAQRAWQSDRWNDVRLMLRNDRLTVSINGWSLVDCSSGRFAGARAGVRILCRPGQSFRLARWSPLDADPAASATAQKDALPPATGEGR